MHKEGFVKNAIEIKEVPVLKVIQTYVELNRKGVDYLGLCPFHEEKSPSFSVSVRKNIYKCFGCGRSGTNGVQFLMDLENRTYPEALHEVADIGNIIVEYKDGVQIKQVKEQYKREKAERERLWALMKKVHQYYLENHNEYFKKLEQCSSIETREESWKVEVLGRVYSKNTFEKFGICYAPGEAVLYQHAKKEGWNLIDLKLIGAIKENQGGYYDYFNYRVLFPIYDYRGNIIGFGGRAIKWEKGEKYPKYLNSPDTPIYKKSRELYGLFQTKRAIRNAEYAYLVEGYTDLVTMYENNVENVLATGGTALTKEQCQLIKRFTITQDSSGKVTTLRDGDAAGEKATIRDVEILVENECKVSVAFLSVTNPEQYIEVFGKENFEALLNQKGTDTDKQNYQDGSVEKPVSFLPVEHDPDSFLWAYNRDLFLKIIEETLMDGITWRVMYNYELDDFDKREFGIKTAGRLLSHLKSEMRREWYIRELVKVMGKVGKEIKDQIVTEETKRLKKNIRKYNNTQEEDKRKYGIYINNNQYWKEEKNSQISLSNCIIIPLYHVASKENPSRLVKIINNDRPVAQYYTLNLHTDIFVKQQLMEAKLGELGNFMLECRGDDYKKILRKIYAEMPTVYKISTLGYHKKGFYTWGNGIGYNGDFYRADANGLVNYGDHKYLLPGDHFVNEDEDRFDDDSNTDEYISLFKLKEGTCISFEEWTAHMLGVYKENGLMGIAYYLASLYRDIIYPKNRFFPHLFCFGPKGKGKSSLLWSLRFMFGIGRKPMTLGSTTIPAFGRQFMQARNYIVWGDEYHNSLDMDWIKLMMQVYDGGGRELANIKGSKSTDSTSVLSSFAISGQFLPTKDVALLSRCITLYFDYERSIEGDQKFETLKNIENSGTLSQITNSLQKYRKDITLEFDRTFDRLKSEIELSLKDYPGILPRTIKNHLIPLTVVKILSEKEAFCKIKSPSGKEFSFLEALKIFLVKIIIKQHKALSTQDEVAIFWKIFSQLEIEKRIKHDVDFLIQNKKKIKIKKKGTRRETKDLFFEGEKKLLFMRMTRIHGLYVRETKERGLPKFSEEALMTYFEQSKAFIGAVRAKKFQNNSRTSQCLVFDMDLLMDNRDIDLPLSSIVLKYNLKEDNCDTCQKPKSGTGDICSCNDLPI